MIIGSILAKLFPSLNYYFVILIINYIEILVCTILFSLKLKRNRHFAFRLILSILFSALVLYLLGMLRDFNDSLGIRILNTFILYSLIAVLLKTCYRLSISSLLLTWCSAIACREIVDALFIFLLSMAGVNNRESVSFFGEVVFPRDALIYDVIHLFLQVLITMIFYRADTMKKDKDVTKNSLLLSFILIVFTAVIKTIVLYYEAESHSLYLICVGLFLALSVLVLIIRTGILSENKYRQELKVMDEVLYMEKKQFKNVKDNMEIINIKCHDLRHHLDDLEGKLTNDEVRSLKKAINIYDKTIKTGSDTLDTILYEKQLLCEKDNIKITCLADGKCLEYINSVHLYSMLNNALSNAIEASKKVEELTSRIIGVTVSCRDDNIYIEVCNYYSANLDKEFKTSKKDKVHHGYGIKSIKYIASIYGGTVKIRTDNNMFFLTIILPRKLKTE